MDVTSKPAKDLTPGDTFITGTGDTLTVTANPQIDPHNISRGHRIACTTPAGDAIYWLFTENAWVIIPSKATR